MLQPDSKAELVLRPPRKAVLMERGFVLSELMINKGWSEQEVMEYLEGCFKKHCRIYYLFQCHLGE